MKQKRRVINFILSVVCCLCVFFGSCMESRAEEEGIRTGIFEYNGVSYPYYYTNKLKALNFNSYFGGYDTHVFTTNVYLMHVRITNNSIYCIAISEEPFTDYYRVLDANGNVKSTKSTFNSSVRNIKGKEYYTCVLSTDKTYQWDISPFGVDFSNVNSISEPFFDYFAGDSFDNLFPFIPDFNNYYHEDTDRWLNDLRAEVEDGTLYATWDGLAGEGLHVLEGYQNTYVQFHIQFIDDKGTSSITDDEYTELFEFYTELSKNEFSISLSDFEVPEGYRLWCMWAEPYWYFNDDINSTMFKGKLSYLFFDENGVSDRPLIKDTGDIYNPLDPNLSNWNAITNFTGDYFYNMNNVMNNTFNSWDGSAMGSDNDKLGNALAGYSQHEEVIINQVSSNIRNFDFDNYLTFSDKVNAGVSFGSMLINKFFVESGDFTILFVVGCIMVFLFVVVGIWRFSK